MTESLYKCSDCLDVSTEINWVDDNTMSSQCCNATVTEVKRKHGDDCCCLNCDPDGIVQAYFARTGRVL